MTIDYETVYRVKYTFNGGNQRTNEDHAAHRLRGLIRFHRTVQRTDRIPRKGIQDDVVIISILDYRYVYFIIQSADHTQRRSFSAAAGTEHGDERPALDPGIEIDNCLPLFRPSQPSLTARQDCPKQVLSKFLLDLY